MRDLIEQLIADQLTPFQERMAEAQSGADDAQRRLRNQGRIGVISAVQAQPPRCKVKHGDNETPWIKWLTLRAGTTREWDPPTLGEQCLLINYGGGDDGAQVAALCGLFSGAHPAPWDSLDVHGREYPDGTRFSYHHAEHRLLWEIGSTTITSDRSKIELMHGGNGIRIDGSGVHAIGSGLDHNGTNVGEDHVHDGVTSGPSKTGGPV